jgi:hypothetical protein
MKTIKNRIVIHTGPGKTGSSAVQAWLSSHQTLLQAEGVFYPDHKVSAAKISSGNLHDVLAQDNMGRWRVNDEKVTKLLASFKASEASILLLSSEFFFHNIEALYKLIPEAEFVAYIRNPVELLESNYNQAIKRHSKINKFVAPQKLENYFWPYLQKVFNSIPRQQIHLRPYEKTLMVKGNIVSDLLDVLGLVVEVEDKKINPSFTFNALEFKRLCNYFHLGPLESELDVILQTCNIGDRKYSLMPSDTFSCLNNESCVVMQAFIDKFEQFHLLALLEKFKNSAQKVIVKQQASVEDLHSIADYIKQHDHRLYNQLSNLLQQNSNLMIDNPAIYQAFSVEYSTLDKKMLIDDTLLMHINQFTVHPTKREKICYEMSIYFESVNEFKQALSFAKASCFFNPANVDFVQQLNKLLKQSNMSTIDSVNDIQIETAPKKSVISKIKNYVSSLAL